MSEDQPPPGAGSGPSCRWDDDLGGRIERARWLALALLADLEAWLSGRLGPTTDPTYRLSRGIAAIPDPRQRIAAYVSSVLVARWDQALNPWFRSGCQLEIDIAPDERIRVTGLGSVEGPAAELTFTRSCVVRRSGAYRELSDRWNLRVMATADLESVRDAFLTREPGVRL